MKLPTNKTNSAAKGLVGHSLPLKLLFGQGQVGLRDAIRISVGRAIRDKARFWFSLPYMLMFGVFAAGSAGNWVYGMTSTGSFCLFLVLFSVVPWRIRFHRSRSFRFHWSIALNALLACAAGAVAFSTAILVPAWLFLPPHSVAWMLGHPMNWLFWSFIFPLVGLSITLAEDAKTIGCRQQDRAEKLVRLAEEARAAALRAQINPHFFFNALNTIAALIPERPSDAERAVELLAEALRPALTGDQPALSPVRDELRIARAYAELETLRWRDRVGFDFLTPDDEADGLLDTLVPSLSLQPILENAVRHGASKTSERYRIELRVGSSIGEDGVEIELRNGPADQWSGFDVELLSEVPFAPGHALHNIALRLGAHFGSGARLEVRTGNSLLGWVRMTVPRYGKTHGVDVNRQTPTERKAPV